jgi:hypothetical protein
MSTRAVPYILAMLVVRASAFAQAPVDTGPPPDATAPSTTMLLQPAHEPPTPVRRSHLWATVHVLGVDLGLFTVGRLSGLVIGGREYLKISPSTIKRNITGGWEWDEDQFSVNQFRHPYQGSLLFNGARANGFGFWGSTLYAIGGSLVWEVVMENEVPSINDQITTPFGGALFGEIVHRFGRSLRWRRNCFGCRVVAAVVDPMGALTNAVHGDAWTLTEPPPRFGYLALGWSGISYDLDSPSGERLVRDNVRLHAALALTYGLPVDPRFVPRLPMDYFDVLIEGNISTSSAPIRIHARGLVWGREFCLGRARGLGGVIASFDFADPDRIRVGAVSVGAGAVVHVPIGHKAFLQTTLVAGLIPYGTAGADVNEDQAGAETERDYHRGPGAAATLELKLARRGWGMLHASTRGFYINGRRFEEGSEYIDYTRVGLMAAIYGRSGIDVEVIASARRANFRGEARDLIENFGQLRISYVYTSDMDFGGVP